MISKFTYVRNLAVFKDFRWNLRDEGNNPVSFKKLNIIFGRNYSGKTTLSRMVRGLETGSISRNYTKPEFELAFSDGANVTERNLTNSGHTIRVFNEDFVRENLRFIVNPDESITPFAVLGGNASIELELQELRLLLGDKTEGAEFGLYRELKDSLVMTSLAEQSYNSAMRTLEGQLTQKAVQKPSGIKHLPERFGDVNYNRPKLESDIAKVLDPLFSPLTSSSELEAINLTKEQGNPNIPAIAAPNLDLNNIIGRATTLLTRVISSSNKISELVSDALLNRWVQQGHQLHQNKPLDCAFCGNRISERRWKDLESHFDQELRLFESEIDESLSQIGSAINTLKKSIQFDKASFYIKFHPELDRLTAIREFFIENACKNLELAKTRLQQRKKDLLTPQPELKFDDSSTRLMWCWNIYEGLRIKANEYSGRLQADQMEAQQLLRLQEVCRFVKEINYQARAMEVESLRIAYERNNKKSNDVKEKVLETLRLIDDKQRLLNDEEKGALKVNEYLNNFFGHNFLSLQSLEHDDPTGKKKVKFEVVRNGSKAHHLSEGECSLIAFCYFVAKLNDVETAGSKAIIWIDDPISSLDSNHIFFIHSLIHAEIVAKDIFLQLFISTHNLDFLKYLRRLPNAGATNSNKHCWYFIVSRVETESKLQLMPKYLRDYVTEFNFLFHQLYLSSLADDTDVTQHQLYYNFGNNTRKFLEAFLFYKYPDKVGDTERLRRFFEGDVQAAAMADRINNEYSHLEGIFERSMTPIDVPEMKKVASYILKKIEERDSDQYTALLGSIGVTV